MATDICPWLGTAEDREIRRAETSEAHLCYAQEPPAEIDLDHQTQFCLTDEHRACRFFRQPPQATASSKSHVLGPMEDEVGPRPEGLPILRSLLWGAAVLAVVAVVYYYGSSILRSSPRATPVASPGENRPSSSGKTPTPAPSIDASAPSPTFDFVVPTETPTPYPGGSIITLSPNSDKVGWVASDESRANHLGDSYLYAGIFDGVLYHSILQFDLSGVPRGARIHAAVLELGGLDNRRLGNSGVWEVRILSREMDENWDRLTFQDVHNAPIQWTVQPAIGASDLYVGRSNAFAFAGELLRDLELRLLEEHYAVSFRIDGPFAGENSIFAWDSGHGPASNGRLPVLLLNVGPPPLTPLPSGTPPFVVVTSTPTPANVLTAAAYVRTATAVARTTGQPTPTSIYEWTATPEHVVTSTPIPANQATAEHNDAVATAIALTTGTFTPAPVEQVTATPTPAWIAEGELTPTPLPPATPSLPEALRERILFESNRAGGAGP